MNKEKNSTIKLKLDPKFKHPIQTDLVAWSHDKNSYRIHFELADGCNNPLMLQNGSIYAKLDFKKEGAAIVQDLEVDSAFQGLVSLVIPYSILGYEGEVQASVYLDFEDRTHDLGSFIFEMKRSSIDDKLPDLSFYVSQWDEAMKEWKEKQAEVTDITNAMQLQLDNIDKQIVEQDIVKKNDFETYKSKTDTAIANNGNQLSDLKAIVNTKASKEDLDSSVEKLEKDIANTSSGLIGDYKNLNELNTAYPKGAKGFATVEVNGVIHRFTWNGTRWEDRGPFNGMGIADNSIDYKKIQKIGQNYDVVYTNGIPNVKLDAKEIIMPKDSFYLYGRGRSQTISETSISLKNGVHTYITFNFQTSLYKTYNSLSDYNIKVTADELFVGVISFKGANSNEILNIHLKGDYLIDGQLASRMNVDFLWDGNKNIKNDSIPYQKTEYFGSAVDFIFTKKLIDIDELNLSVTIPDGMYLLRGGQARDTLKDTVIKLTTQHTYIYINASTKEITYYTSVSKIQNASKDDVLVSVVSFDDATLKKIKSIYVKGDYTVNGKVVSRLTDFENPIPDDNKKYFTDNIPNENYIPVKDIKGFPVSELKYDTIKEDDILGQYDKILDETQNWVTKTVLGNDSTDTYPIYQYEFKPEQVPAARFIKTYPKIILVTCTHGEEKMGALSLANLMTDVHENWRTDETLKFIRQNAHLIIIPILNPHGFANKRRKNGNGVDINRNSSFRWERSSSDDPNASTYKGTAPFTEKENQYIRELVKNNKDATAFFDYHMNGTSGGAGDYIHNFWHYIEDRKNDKGFNELNELSTRNIMLMTNRSQESYGIDKNSGWCGLINYNGRDSSIAAYAYEEGIPGFTIECLKKLQHEDVVYSKEAIKISTEFIGNHILNVCRSFA